MLFNAVSKGYNHDHSTIYTYRDPNFGNLAQLAWREMLEREQSDKKIYNGFIGSDTGLEKFAGFVSTAFGGKAALLHDDGGLGVNLGGGRARSAFKERSYEL